MWEMTCLARQQNWCDGGESHAAHTAIVSSSGSSSPMSPRSRGVFRGNVTSPFLLHQFVEEPGDALLPSLRETAAAMCRTASRETLYAVIELMQRAHLSLHNESSSAVSSCEVMPMRRSISQPCVRNPCSGGESASSAMLRELAGAPAAVKLGLDLGGSLTKLVIATPKTTSFSSRCKAARTDEALSVCVQVEGSPPLSLHFASTSTDELEEVLKSWGGGATVAEEENSGRRVVAAGGGAHKLRGKFRLALGIELEPFREMQSIVDGLLLLHELQVANEVFQVKAEEHHAYEAASSWPKPLLPLLLVNVGSGVSCLLVSREGYARIGGTAIGGATFLGLARALTAARTFDQALGLAGKGDAARVDTLVQDIYGHTGCSDLGLPPDLTAASFGKLAREKTAVYSDADVCRALLEMVAQSCCVLARAHAGQLGCRRRVFFAGGFVDGNPLARATISNSLRSLGGRAHFLRHSDYLGALGAVAKCLSGGPKHKVLQISHHTDDAYHPRSPP